MKLCTPAAGCLIRSHQVAGDHSRLRQWKPLKDSIVMRQNNKRGRQLAGPVCTFYSFVLRVCVDPFDSRFSQWLITSDYRSDRVDRRRRVRPAPASAVAKSAAASSPEPPLPPGMEPVFGSSTGGVAVALTGVSVGASVGVLVGVSFGTSVSPFGGISVAVAVAVLVGVGVSC
jgi:hypothetical protein